MSPIATSLPNNVHPLQEYALIAAKDKSGFLADNDINPDSIASADVKKATIDAQGVITGLTLGDVDVNDEGLKTKIRAFVCNGKVAGQALVSSTFTTALWFLDRARMVVLQGFSTV